jgi:hypothetical protein
MYYSLRGKSLSKVEIPRLDREYDQYLLEELGRVGTEVRDLKLFQPGFLDTFLPV